MNNKTGVSVPVEAIEAVDSQQGLVTIRLGHPPRRPTIGERLEGCALLGLIGPVWLFTMLIAFTVGCAHPELHPLWWFK